MEKSLSEQDEKTLEEMKNWVRKEQFGMLLTQTVVAMGISSAIVVLIFAVVDAAPGWVQMLMSLF